MSIKQLLADFMSALVAVAFFGTVVMWLSIFAAVL